MKAPHAISLRERFADSKKAYGEIERNRSLETLFNAEDMIDAMAPLPTTYDVFPIQQYNFSEFGYTDLWNGMYVYPMGYEVGARIMEKAVREEIETNPSLDKVRTPEFEDKYVLKQSMMPNRYKKIIFLPGSNLLHVIDFDAVLKLLHADETIMVKPHPIMTLEGLRLLAAKVGFERIIDPKESGMEYLEGCEQAWGTANSEIAMRAALLGIRYGDVTNVQFLPTMTYSAIHRLLGDDADMNRKVVLAAISSKQSGIIMPWHSEVEMGERLEAFFSLAMSIKDDLKSMYPKFTPIQFSPNRGE